MSTSEPPQPEPEQTPTPAPSHEEPDWAKRLRQSVESLPSKLRASLSDDDKNQIAETVHGLFERSGAFEDPQKQQQQQQEPTQEPTTEPTTTKSEPKKRGLSSFASWFAGEE